MPATANLVLRNFRWRIEQTTPTSNISDRPFRWLDTEIVDPEDSPLTRTFTVMWQEDEPPEIGSSVIDVTERESNHSFLVAVNYPHEYKLYDRQQMMLLDRHDLIKTLRDDRLYFGYSQNHPNDDLRLWNRRVIRASMEEEFEDTSTLVLEVQCTISELEV